MKRLGSMMIASLLFLPAAASAQTTSTIPPENNPPTIQQLGIGQANGHYPCMRSFDRGVAAIRAGFVGDGVNCLQRSAAQGDTRALRAIGLMLLNGEYLAPAPEEAVGYFYEASLRGDAESMYLLGQSFSRGIGVARDDEIGRFWLNRAAQEGYTAPQS